MTLPGATPRLADPFAVHPALPTGPDGVVIAAPAKLNLFLEILRRRPDGFHELESLMAAVELFDTLEIRTRGAAVKPGFVGDRPRGTTGAAVKPGLAGDRSRDPTDGALTLFCEPASLSAGPDNLVHKAATALRTHVNRPQLGAEIRLTKRIPAQAGLGGGSSDAAAALVGLNRIWKLGLTREELVGIAASVGSDVAFFLTLPAAWCTGRGEIATPEPIAEGARPFHFVLVFPPVGLGTAGVYRRLAVPEKPVPGAGVRNAFRTGDAEALGRALFNRLEEPALALEPLVGRIRQRLAACGPCGAMMSGSGSTVFAVCHDRPHAVKVAEKFLDSRPADEPESRVLVLRSFTP
ncbi:MAG: 4-(cytidine 5'-diphospho)-2-C-methyl-D-erythritol kinase [Planctomycetes bacterium]|nr:4-(cytidine 5'-diphospho)-2-C-methyl-D-erythritol kinase [Planctomycetota bacterium]